MEPIEGSETSAFKPQTPGKYPKENTLQVSSWLLINILSLGLRFKSFIILLPPIPTKVRETIKTIKLKERKLIKMVYVLLFSLY